MKPVLMHASWTFGQEGNTEGTTSDYEELTIEYQNTGLNGEGLFVIKTEGWSTEDLTDLYAFLEGIKVKTHKSFTA